MKNIIQNLPKTNDLIENIKSKINKEFELIEKKLKNNIGQIKTNKNFNTLWIDGTVSGELIDTDDGYRIRFDGQSSSFTHFENLKCLAKPDEELCSIPIL